MKYIKKFNNDAQLETYKKSNFVSPHIYLDNNLNTVKFMQEYQQLEYISSTQTGGQYIDLGCKLMENTDDIEIDIKFIINDRFRSGSWYCSDKGGNQATLLNSVLENNSSWPGFALRRETGTGEGYKANLYLYAKWQFSNSAYNNNKYYANNLGGGYAGTTKTTNLVLYEKHFLLNNIPQSQCHNISTTLFCTYMEYQNKYDRFTIADLYYLKIKKGGKVIRDLIPVKKVATNEIGLYDIENDHLYISQGDEPFEGGPIINN